MPIDSDVVVLVNEIVEWGTDTCAAVIVIPKAPAASYPMRTDTLVGLNYPPAGGTPIVE